MLKILFVCVHNTARSQIAETYLNALGKGYFFAESSGLEPGILNPDVVKVMAEDGYDISKNAVKSVFEFYREGRRYHYVIKVCDQINGQKCPIFPATLDVLNWNHEDPAAYTGPEDERLVAVRRIRDEIKQNIVDFIDQHILEQIEVTWSENKDIFTETHNNNNLETHVLSFIGLDKEHVHFDRSLIKDSVMSQNSDWLESLASVWQIYFGSFLLDHLHLEKFKPIHLVGLMQYFWEEYSDKYASRMNLNKFSLYLYSVFELKNLNPKIREHDLSKQYELTQTEVFIKDTINKEEVLLFVTSRLESGLITGYDLEDSKFTSIHILSNGHEERVDFKAWIETHQKDALLIALKQDS